MAGGSDMKAHEKTYAQMISMFKWGGLACFLIAAAVVWLIA